MKLKLTKFQKIIELLTIITLSLLCIYLIKSWDNLPDQIPGHYNAAGIVNRWTDKKEILIMPILSITLYILLTVISFFPSIWNIPVKITEKNRDFVYKNLKSMLILLKLEVTTVFLYITYCDINRHYLGALWLPIMLTVLFGTIIYYLIKIKKNKLC